MIGLGFSLTTLACAVRRAFPVFGPADLFATGAPGVWYDLSLTDGTLFQDAAGTLPVTAVEQPVGRMLDKSKGLVLGPELVVNGGFDADLSGWTTSAWVYRAGNAYLNTDTAFQSITQTAPMVVGRSYRISYNYQVVSGSIQMVFNSQITADTVKGVGTGTASFIFTLMDARAAQFSIRSGTAAAEAYIDNISIRELPGNDAFQTTSANRPVLSARYNLLTKAEQFDDAATWLTAGRATITANNTTDPLGGNTADKITETVDNGTHRVTQSIVYPSNTNLTASFFLKKGTRDWVWISCNQDINVAVQYFNLNSISVGTNTSTGSGMSKVSASIVDAGNGWRKCTFTVSVGALGDTSKTINCGLASADGTASYAGSTSEYGYIWGADLRVANDGIGLPPYQRVNTATDYDTVGFPLYLRFNGSTQFLQTNSIDFSSTDKVLVAAGVRKLSDSTAATVAELSANSGVTPNTFAVFAPGAVAPNYAFRSSGTSDSVATATTFASPITNVLVGLGEVASDTAILRINGSQAASSTADQGTGNLGQHPLYIGARAGTSLFFNGRLYSLIVAGIKPTDAQILGVETYINSLTKAF